ncbi:GGDEF domain-containing protein [Chitinimonas lacunae]|uniref:diguanylate cyclase n=1 Tax=Chitinimonas lacunae TaxID=1963018 RepID=A0ABV8MNC1_9NEIS
MNDTDKEILYKRKAYFLAQTFFIKDNSADLLLNAHKYDFDILFFDQTADFLRALDDGDDEDLFVVDLDVLYNLQADRNNRTLFLRDLLKLLPDNRHYVYLQTEKQSGRFLLQKMLIDSNCLAYAEKPISNENLIDKLFQLFARHQRDSQGRVLYLGAEVELDIDLLSQRRISVRPHDDVQSLHLEVKDWRPDVVVIEDGFFARTEVVAEIIKKNIETDPSLDIILFQRRADTEQARRAIAVGFDDVLVNQASDIATRQLINRLAKIRINKDLISKDRATGLLNKIGFQQRARELIRQAESRKKSLCLTVFDIDKFKTINDTWGHYFGDIVIKRLSLLLGNYVGERDLLSRFGGEEFVMLFWDIDPDAMQARLDEIREAFHAISFEVEPGDIRQFSFSGGGAFFPEFRSENELFLQADAKLYDAKHGGRNQIRL